MERDGGRVPEDSGRGIRSGSRFFVLLALVITCMALVTALVKPAWANAGDITRVSLSETGQQAEADSSGASISADGRYVAWSSAADNLVAGDTNGLTDIFLRDRLNNTTRIISLDWDGSPAEGDSNSPSVSGDGRYVAFESDASNLIPDDNNGFTDVFVRDTLHNTTTRASVTNNGAQAAGASYAPHISADGRYVEFYSEASNLVSGDTFGFEDVFVRDIVGNTTIRVSVASGNQQANQPSAADAAISADGHCVVFSSIATNLVDPDSNGAQDVFLHNLTDRTTKLISVSSEGAQGNGDSYAAGISADGHYVLFSSIASNLVDGDTNDSEDLFLYDTAMKTTTRVSVTAAGAQADGNSYGGSISGDGRSIVFSSDAANLAGSDTWATNIFLRDQQTGAVILVSRAPDGSSADGDSDGGAISADGASIAFASNGSNLVAGDTNGMQDIFVRNVSAVPATETPTATSTATDTATATSTSTPTASATETATASSTPTASATATETETATPTNSATATATETETATPTSTATSTATALPTDLHIGDLDGSSAWSGNKWSAKITIAVHDSNERLVANARVSGAWSGGTTGTASCTTNTTGRCTVASPLMANSRTSVTFTASKLQAEPLPYNAAANHDPDGDSTGTRITARPPVFTARASSGGTIRESSEKSNTGQYVSASAPTFNVGDDALKRQYRAVLSFNTSGLPDKAVITKVMLSLTKESITGSASPFSALGGLMIDVRNGYFGTLPALQATDFQAAASLSGIGPYSPAPVLGVYTINLSSSSFQYINKLSTNGGLTQLRLRFRLDDNNDLNANYITLYSGYSVVVNRPRLTINYYMP